MGAITKTTTQLVLALALGAILGGVIGDLLVSLLPGGGLALGGGIVPPMEEGSDAKDCTP